jgi:hypothetical protein
MMFLLFAGLTLDEPVLGITVLTKNRDRPLERYRQCFPAGPAGRLAGLSRDSWLGQRNNHALAIKVFDGGVSGPIESGDISEGLMGQLICLHMVPNDLNVIQSRGVFWQPFDRDPVCAAGKDCA